MPEMLFGLELPGGPPAESIVVGAVAVVEYIDPVTSERYLSLLSSDMPVWARLGMLQVACACDETTAASMFEPDD